MTKLKLLELLESHKGQYLSGEAIGQSLGISRAAIWKNINLLKEEGYDIESVKKKGYTLNINSDILSEVKLREFLNKDFPIHRIQLYKTIDSTNKVALKTYIEEDETWTVVASEKQEKGQAKDKMTFYSPEGKGVYMSVAIDIQKHIEDIRDLTGQNSQIVQEVLREEAGVETTIGRDNNLYYRDRKLAGIMTQVLLEAESGFVKGMVVGIGIYVHEANGENIALTEINGRYCNRSQLIAKVINKLYERYKEQ